MYLKFINKLFLILAIILSIGNSYADIPLATDRRIKTYVYNANEVYLLLIRSGFQSSVEFERGEEIKTLSLGDAYSWNITPVGNRMFIKPLENDIRTNMTVITNKRTYQFDVVSQNGDDDNMNEDISYVVRFYYPVKNEN
jgi:type IV secretion system protein VirB9